MTATTSEKRRPPAAGMGRKKGVLNNVTRDVKHVIRQLIEDNADKVQGWLDRVARQNPGRATQLYIRLCEFELPRRVQGTLTIQTPANDKPEPVTAESVHERLKRMPKPPPSAALPAPAVTAAAIAPRPVPTLVAVPIAAQRSPDEATPAAEAESPSAPPRPAREREAVLDAEPDPATGAWSVLVQKPATPQLPPGVTILGPPRPPPPGAKAADPQDIRRALERIR